MELQRRKALLPNLKEIVTNPETLTQMVGMSLAERVAALSGIYSGIKVSEMFVWKALKSARIREKVIRLVKSKSKRSDAYIDRKLTYAARELFLAHKLKRRIIFVGEC